MKKAMANGPRRTIAAKRLVLQFKLSRSHLRLRKPISAKALYIFSSSFSTFQSSLGTCDGNMILRGIVVPNP